MRRAAALLLLLSATGLSAEASAGSIRPPAPGGDAREIMERANRALYYAGEDMTAKVVLELRSGDAIRGLRVMTMLRLNQPGGEQRYFLYFHQPGDARRLSCMTWKHVGKPDERWMYVPATGRVVKVTAPERSSFLGSEFLREEFSGRDVDADLHRFVRMEPMDGRACYVVESSPLQGEELTRVLSWIDQETFLPLRQEFRNARGETWRVFTGGKIAWIGSRARPERYPTLLERAMAHRPEGRWTRVVLDSVQYDVGLREADFSLEHLRVPLSEWMDGKARSAAR